MKREFKNLIYSWLSTVKSNSDLNRFLDIIHDHDILSNYNIDDKNEEISVSLWFKLNLYLKKEIEIDQKSHFHINIPCIARRGPIEKFIDSNIFSVSIQVWRNSMLDKFEKDIWENLGKIMYS